MSTEFVTALIKVQEELPKLEKNADNPFFKSKYVPLEEVITKIVPILNKHGFAIVQQLSSVDGKPALRTRLIHVTGEELDETGVVVMKMEDPQAQGSAITYNRRYAIMALLGLVGDVDDDANKATMPPKEKLNGIDTSAEKDAFAL